MDEVAFGRYRLIELIGQGAMGKVYKAHDTMMRRDVAIKVLPPERATEPEYADRFRREAYTVANLTEPHIIPIYETGEIDGRLYLVMPVIKGTDLQTLLRRDGPMTPERAVRVIEQLAAALDAAHEAGLVHRDVKPSNALVTAQDFVYLIDFGIVQQASAAKLTRTGAAVGTWAYMAPERFGTGTTDARSDVYALACVLYECLTAQLPYQGDSLEQQVSGHLTMDPPRPSVFDPAIPASFDDVIARGMAKNPERRYQAAHQLATAAHQALTGTFTQTSSPATATQIDDSPRPATVPLPTMLDTPSELTITGTQARDVGQFAREISRHPTQLTPVQPTPTASTPARPSRPARPVLQRPSRHTTIALLAGVVALIAIYASVKLFSPHVTSPSQQNHVLDVARVLVPIVAAVAVLVAVLLLLRVRLQQLLIRFMRGHVVICGLSYVGLEFVRQLRDAGYKTVVIEADMANPHVSPCRGWGVPVIVGDARQQSTLRATGVTRAAKLLAVTPDNGTNAEIVTRALESVPGQAGDPDEHAPQGHPGGPANSRYGRKLSCLAQIDDPDLCVLLRLQESNRGDTKSALDFFNLEQTSAGLLLEENPIESEQQPHILVAHLDALGNALILLAARNYQRERKDNPAPLRVTVVDEQADQRLNALLEQYPALGQLCEFTTYGADVRGIRQLAADSREQAGPPISRAYVTGYRDESTVQTALTLRHELDATVPIVVALWQAGGVASLLRDEKTGSGQKVTVFRTLEKTCTPELVEGGSSEAIAHAVHRRYRELEHAAGRPAPPWSELDGGVKAANRAHARDIAVKLHTIGCEITPLRDWGAEEFTFTTDEVEKLAVIEHDRWWEFKRADGWSLGDKDPQHPEFKKNPYMVPFEELPADIAEYDRDFVRAIPEMLASVALQVIRVRSSNAGSNTSVEQPV